MKRTYSSLVSVLPERNTAPYHHYTSDDLCCDLFFFSYFATNCDPEAKGGCGELVDVLDGVVYKARRGGEIVVGM